MIEQLSFKIDLNLADTLLMMKGLFYLTNLNYVQLDRAKTQKKQIGVNLINMPLFC